MKNSTLLRLFFISIGLPLICASTSSASTSSTAITLKSKPEPTSTLVDMTNSAPAVQLKDQGILIQSAPEESQVSGRDGRAKRLEELINKGQYKEIAELGKEIGDEEMLKCICQVVTRLGHFWSLFGYLEQRNMVPSFLAHREMVLAREVIVETGILGADHRGRCDSIYDAIVLSLSQDRHNRVADLFKAAQERPVWEHMFDWFVRGFFERHPPVKDSMPLKRFLTFHGEELGKKYPATFEIICQELVGNLRCRLGNLASQKLLIGLVGQPSLLTPVAFAKGFLHTADDRDRANLINYGYKEAIEEGLKGDYGSGGRKLWKVMVDEYPTRFSGEYPSTDEARKVALKGLFTKQDREEQWIVNNSQNPQTTLRVKYLTKYLYELDINVPNVLWVIIAEYATVPTLLDVEQ